MDTLKDFERRVAGVLGVTGGSVRDAFRRASGSPVLSASLELELGVDVSELGVNGLEDPLWSAYRAYVVRAAGGKSRSRRSVESSALDATRVGSATYFRPIRTHDMDYVYELMVGGRAGDRWQFHGATPGPDEFQHRLWAGVLVQQLVFARRDGERLGAVSCYNADLRAGHGCVSAIFDPATRDLGWPLEGVFLFVQYLFENWPFRRLFFEVSEFNLAQFESSLRAHCSLEGTLQDYYFGNGRHWARYVFALERDVIERFLRDSGDEMVTNAPGEPLSLPVFCDYMGATLAVLRGVEDMDLPVTLGPDTDVWRGLSLNSIERFEMLVAVEEISGLITMDEALGARSLGSLFEHVSSLNV